MAILLGLRPPTRLCWRRWDDSFVVFDDASGQTHQLDMLTGSALLAIEESPMSIDGLTDQLGMQFSLTREEIETAIPAIVEQLKSAALIETIAR